MFPSISQLSSSWEHAAERETAWEMLVQFHFNHVFFESNLNPFVLIPGLSNSPQDMDIEKKI